MEARILILLFILFLFSILFVFGFKKNKRSTGRVPPGSMGLPFIGQSLEVIKALKYDKIDEWFKERIRKYGPVSKANLFGYPTVVLHGPAANKFIYSTCDGNELANAHPPSVSRLFGERNILELHGDEHKRIRTAVIPFLRVDILKQSVAKIEEEIQYHFRTHWHGKHEVHAQSLMKILSFNSSCTLLFGIERGARREKFQPHLHEMMESLLSVPINLPFTQFYRGIKAREKLLPIVVDLMNEKKMILAEQKQQGLENAQTDLITSLLSVCDDNNGSTMSTEEIVDNSIALMFAGYGTTAVLLTFLIRILATNESIYSSVFKEHEEIAKSKSTGEALTWEDIIKMKYTWKVASEILRVYTPVNVTFRRALEDIEYGGYIIPKGWQVMLTPSMTHMDESIFQNPPKIDPGRFEKHAPSLPAFSYVPFGSGPRICPGIEFVKMESLVMIHHLVREFKLELVNKDEPFKRIPFPEFENRLLVRIQPITKTK
ncbi:taxane 10-beta-hydroxylase-like [Rutidosis leptorrhynchoides]|uniref:taxane 10-beta-hydroxylase-like n=1 Tax=Rutidosis leptorrhynchoides TaxID=125765 RepID=UPI003A99D79E